MSRENVVWDIGQIDQTMRRNTERLAIVYSAAGARFSKDHKIYHMIIIRLS